MKYSIIIPCYNTSGTLKQAVMNVRDSGLIDYEIILVDDGSKDSTSALCDRLADMHENICVFHKENGGVSSARNLGIEKAQGEYIWFFDSDDQVDPGSMIQSVRIIEKYQPDILMFGMSLDYYAGKRRYQRLELYYDHECLLTHDELGKVFAELYHNNMLTPCWNKLFRRELLISNGLLFHTEMFVMEDFLFSLEALSKCNTIYVLPQVVYHYNQENKWVNDHVAQRVNRVADLAEYVSHFERELADYPEILTTMFFMLLRQKLSVQTLKEIAEAAQSACASKFASDSYIKYCSEEDKAFLQKLQQGHYKELYWLYRKSRIRNIMVSIVKRTRIYRLITGTPTKRVIW